MSEETNAKIEVYQSGVFKKGFDKLSVDQLADLILKLHRLPELRRKEILRECADTNLLTSS